MPVPKSTVLRSVALAPDGIDASHVFSFCVTPTEQSDAMLDGTVYTVPAEADGAVYTTAGAAATPTSAARAATRRKEVVTEVAYGTCYTGTRNRTTRTEVTPEV